MVLRVSRRPLFWGIVIVLLVAAAGLILRIRSFPLDNDEIWEIWQTFGTPQQIIQWTSSTEYPTYMLMLGGWKELVGLHPYVLRYFSLLLALPGTAFMYRALRRLQGEWAGILGALAYGAFPISQFISLYTRSYVIAFSVLPLALWLTSRYFDRATILRGVWLGLTLYLLYVSTVTIIPAMGLFALYVLVVYQKQSWRAILPAIIAAILILPDFVVNKVQHVAAQTTSMRMLTPGPLPGSLFVFFDFFTRSPVWYVLVVAAAVWILYAARRRIIMNRQRTIALFWLGWLIVVPLLLYVFDPKLGYYNVKRYGWWYVFGIALLVGVGLALLPRVGRWLAAGTLALIIFLPLGLSSFGYIVTPLGDDLSWLRDHMQAGDALMLAPRLTCDYPEEWDYYTRLYFPMGLHYVNSAEGTQRVWYVSPEDDASRGVEQELSRTRMVGRFVGPPGCLFRLFEAPPDPQGILFENGMRFHGFEVMDGDRPLNFPLVYRENQPIRVRLWWSVDQPVTLDYSVNLNLREKATIVSQTDSAPQLIYPQDAPVETSQWTPGQIYVEERTLTTPPADYRDVFDMTIAVYWFGEPTHRFSAPGEQADGSLDLTKVTLVAW